MRAKKGSVSIGARNGMLRLRWTHQGKSYQLSLGWADSPAGRTAARGRAAEIEADLRLERFDPTLTKYRPTSAAPPPPSTVELFEQFAEHRRAGGTSGQAISSRYRPLLGNLRRFGRSIEGEQDARDFVELLRSRQSALIANQNLSLLRGFGAWAVSSDHWTINHFEGIPRQRGDRRLNPKRAAMSRAEIAAFLATCRAHPIYSHYHDYCLTLFSLGLRPSEASGLRWKHIDWERRTIAICESLSRAPDGRAAGYARQRKATKTGKIRTINLRPKLLAMFQSRLGDRGPDDLIFTTPNGKPINDHVFSQRVWRGICEQCQIDRVPYAARHSLGSHLIHDGTPITSVAAVLGNNTETVSRHYAHELGLPDMPDF